MWLKTHYRQRLQKISTINNPNKKPLCALHGHFLCYNGNYLIYYIKLNRKLLTAL